MNIILGDYNAECARQRYTVLELDRFRIGQDGPEESAWCVLTDLSQADLQQLPESQQLHESLIAHYRSGDWAQCAELIDQLRGQWAGEMDSFYDILAVRVSEYQQNPPGDNWTFVIQK